MVSSGYNEIKLTVNLEPLEGKIQVLELIGEMDAFTLEAKKDEILKYANDFSGEYFALNLAGLNYLNSLSISFILELSDLMDKRGKKLVIVSARPNVKDVLKVIGVFEGVQYFANLNEFKAKIDGLH